MAATQKLLKALRMGYALTSKEISYRFGVTNPHDTVYSLRQAGFPIYHDPIVRSRGRVTMKYRLGTPSRAVIAAGYKALAAGVV